MRRARVRRVRRAQPEHLIQNQIIAVLKMRHCRVDRVNVMGMYTQDGRWVHTGAKPGTPDLRGEKLSNHKAFYIEVKTPKGRISNNQMLYHYDLVHDGCIHGIARSVEDALKIVQDELIGYGYPDYKGQKQAD